MSDYAASAGRHTPRRDAACVDAAASASRCLLPALLPVAQTHARTCTVLVDEDHTSRLQGCTDSLNALPMRRPPPSFKVFDRAQRHLGRFRKARLRPIHQATGRTRHWGAKGTYHDIQLKGLTWPIIASHFSWCQPQKLAAGQGATNTLPSLTTTRSCGEPAMANRTNSTTASAGRASGQTFRSASAYVVHRPGYLRRTLAYLATGGIPPLPTRQDFPTPVAFGLAALLGFLAGDRA